MQTGNSKWPIVGMVYVISSYYFVYFCHCSSYTTLNLNEWLTEYDSCSVNISNLDPDIWDVGRFEYPVILSKSNATEESPQNCQYLSKETSNGTKGICFHGNNRSFLQRIFCSVNAVIVPKGFGISTNDTARQMMFKHLNDITPTCSKPIYLSKDSRVRFTVTVAQSTLSNKDSLAWQKIKSSLKMTLM